MFAFDWVATKALFGDKINVTIEQIHTVATRGSLRVNHGLSNQIATFPERELCPSVSHHSTLRLSISVTGSFDSQDEQLICPRS